MVVEETGKLSVEMIIYVYTDAGQAGSDRRSMQSGKR